MADRVIAFSLGTSKANLTDLKARLVNSDDSVHMADAGGTFRGKGRGLFVWVGSLPSDFTGHMEVFSEADAATVLGIASINPAVFDPDRDSVKARVESLYAPAREQIRESLGMEEADLDDQLAAIYEAADDRDGYKLAPDGLDAIDPSEPTVDDDGPPETWNFRKQILWGVMAVRRAIRRFDVGTGQGEIEVQTLDGRTSTIQEISDDSEGTEVLGPPQ